ncbi:MAG: nuclear transport factor 2 family protein [Bacteroidota bacterium]
MKRMIVSLSVLSLSLMLFAFTQMDTDKDQITTAVKAFVKSADQQDVDAMDKVMHKEYRTLANQLFGATELSVINKSAYLDMMKAGKLGGDSRKVKIEEIQVIGKNAVVKAKLQGKQLIFETFIQLVKDAEGEWKVISDLPKIEKV